MDPGPSGAEKGLVQNVPPHNILRYKTSFLQKVLPQSVLPEKGLNTKRPAYKMSFPTKSPVPQNVRFPKLPSHKTSSCPHPHMYTCVQDFYSIITIFAMIILLCIPIVSDTHGGGWSRKINARYLHTLMVYL